jgi:hypothetical protein
MKKESEFKADPGHFLRFREGLKRVEGFLGGFLNELIRRNKGKNQQFWVVFWQNMQKP